MAEPTMYERIVERRGRLDYGLTHRDELINDRLFLDALEVLFRPPEGEMASQEETNEQYESMEEVAFGVAKAAKAYVEAVGGGAIDSFGIVTAFDALKEEVRKYNECAEQYESHWE